jgi:hypothetical protein
VLFLGIVEALRHLIRSLQHPAVRALALVGLSIFVLAGCPKKLLPDDPQLRPIQEMLDTQVPPGTPRSNVSLFLDSQGYPLENSRKAGTLVAIIRKIDTQRLEPVTARVTFTFDASDKLTSVELQRTLNDPVQ